MTASARASTRVQVTPAAHFSASKVQPAALKIWSASNALTSPFQTIRCVHFQPRRSSNVAAAFFVAQQAPMRHTVVLRAVRGARSNLFFVAASRAAATYLVARRDLTWSSVRWLIQIQRSGRGTSQTSQHKLTANWYSARSHSYQQDSRSVFAVTSELCLRFWVLVLRNGLTRRLVGAQSIQLASTLASIVRLTPTG